MSRIAAIPILLMIVLLTACRSNGSNAEIKPQPSFQSGIWIDFQAYSGSIPQKDAPVLAALKNNLSALTELNHARFRSGFVNEALADSMESYYGEQFRYRFTELEAIEEVPDYHQWNITVAGSRMDTSTGIVDEVKMLYALRADGNGEWLIYTID
ncbi:hypothetical protein F4V43_00565 [Paenibacillus spiritus]|uniref:DUF4829 domain-containing protein n=1 Tax=Paenibacillus spiritus TaxID=2496557 RepID=A0A5J5GKU6_9BACL|nr:hypothetical protein [Paenibacillus spiritus]KAA9008657.1 hypothetical protein F4V43_00565 [Paenibacillus spiritus]